jgi:hypothetical protein
MYMVCAWHESQHRQVHVNLSATTVDYYRTNCTVLPLESYSFIRSMPSSFETFSSYLRTLSA